MYSSPRWQCAISATRLLWVPLGRNSPASIPTISATRACRAFTVGSSPKTSSPTSAAAIAARIPAEGLVTVSLRRSINLFIFISSSRRIDSRGNHFGCAQQGARLVLGLLPLQFGHRIGDDTSGSLHIQHAILHNAGTN